MAIKNKTAPSDEDVADFINAYVYGEEKKMDSFRLIELIQEWSGCAPTMWGPTMIGFGSYHYKYASGHEGDSMIIGFSPRKAAFSLYVTLPAKEAEDLLKDLGKFKMGKSCIYFKQLSHLNIDVLDRFCKASIDYVKANH